MLNEVYFSIKVKENQDLSELLVKNNYSQKHVDITNAISATGNICSFLYPGAFTKNMYVNIYLHCINCILSTLLKLK